MNLIQLGTSYYLEVNQEVVRITYPQYQTICDLDAGRITSKGIQERLAHYEFQQELVPCSICGDGYLPRAFLTLLERLDTDGSIHEHTIHFTEARGE